MTESEKQKLTGPDFIIVAHGIVGFAIANKTAFNNWVNANSLADGAPQLGEDETDDMLDMAHETTHRLSHMYAQRDAINYIIGMS